MPTDLLLHQTTDLNNTTLGVQAEEFGYDGLWLGELWGQAPSSNSPTSLPGLTG